MIKTRYTGWALVAGMAIASALPADGQNRRGPSLDRLATGLELSDEQVADIEASMEGETPSMWLLASALQANLTADQKEKLFDRAKTAGAYARGVRDGRRSGSRAHTSARGPRGNTGRAARQARRPFPDRALNDLTDEQKEAFRALREENRDQMQALNEARRDGEMDVYEFRSKSEELRASMREKASAIFTDEQRARLETLRERAPANRPGVRGARGTRSGRAAMRPAQGGDGMASALGLTEAQQETVRIHRALMLGTFAPRVAAARTRQGARRR